MMHSAHTANAIFLIMPSRAHQILGVNSIFENDASFSPLIESLLMSRVPKVGKICVMCAIASLQIVA